MADKLGQFQSRVKFYAGILFIGSGPVIFFRPAVVVVVAVDVAVVVVVVVLVLLLVVVLMVEVLVPKRLLRQ